MFEDEETAWCLYCDKMILTQYPLSPIASVAATPKSTASSAAAVTSQKQAADLSSNPGKFSNLDSELPALPSSNQGGNNSRSSSNGSQKSSKLHNYSRKSYTSSLSGSKLKSLSTHTHPHGHTSFLRASRAKVGTTSSVNLRSKPPDSNEGAPPSHSTVSQPQPPANESSQDEASLPRTPQERVGLVSGGSGLYCSVACRTADLRRSQPDTFFAALSLGIERLNASEGWSTPSVIGSSASSNANGEMDYFSVEKVATPSTNPDASGQATIISSPQQKRKHQRNMSWSETSSSTSLNIHSASDLERIPAPPAPVSHARRPMNGLKSMTPMTLASQVPNPFAQSHFIPRRSSSPNTQIQSGLVDSSTNAVKIAQRAEQAYPVNSSLPNMTTTASLLRSYPLAVAAPVQDFVNNHRNKDVDLSRSHVPQILTYSAAVPMARTMSDRHGAYSPQIEEKYIDDNLASALTFDSTTSDESGHTGSIYPYGDKSADERFSSVTSLRSAKSGGTSAEDDNARTGAGSFMFGIPFARPASTTSLPSTLHSTQQAVYMKSSLSNRQGNDHPLKKSPYIALAIPDKTYMTRNNSPYTPSPQPWDDTLVVKADVDIILTKEPLQWDRLVNAAPNQPILYQVPGVKINSASSKKKLFNFPPTN